MPPSPVASQLPLRRKNARGIALVVVLFALALVTIVILAFFNLALLNRNISFSSAGQARANILALSALDYIKGDFIAEIQAGSVNEVDPNGSGIPIYLPTTNAAMVPYRMTTNVAPTSGYPPSLVKWSSGTYPLWPASPSYGNQAGPIRAYAGYSSSNASVNGHFIDASRWTKPDFGTNTTFPAKITPEWVYLTRQGILTNAAPVMATLANAAPTNPSYVVGRYAYTVYDEGGLLDVAAAGYSPSLFSTLTADLARKGNQGFADLTQLDTALTLLTKSQIDSFVNWRNAQTGATAASYLTYLTNTAPATGFLKAASGDQAFLSRQDLIQYWTGPLAASPKLLPYLTTFTREKNAPSWGPQHNAYDPTKLTYWRGADTNTVDPANPTSGRISYAYFDNQNSTNALNSVAQGIYNRFLPNVRVGATFQRNNGDQAISGEPLVKTRFDLNKLAWIANGNILPAGVTATDVYNFFGLKANTDGSWTYNHGDATRILRMDEVASAKREPDIFELVQAVILQGSLGLCSGDPRASGVNDKNAGGEFYRFAQKLDAIGWACPIYRYDVDGKIVYAQEKYQIAQIIANMIDQYDADNYPTEIVLNGEHFYGIENLPYIHAVADTALRSAPGAISFPASSAATSAVGNPLNSIFQAYVHRWVTVSLWNPHQNSIYAGTTGTGAFRVCITAGNEAPTVHDLGATIAGTSVAGSSYSGRTFEPPSSPITDGTLGNGTGTDGPAWIGFYLNDYPNRFSEPTAISYSASFTDPALGGTANMNHPDGKVATALGWQRAGIYLGWSNSPDDPLKVSKCAPYWTGPPAHALPALKYHAANINFLANNSGPTVFGLTLELQYQDVAGKWHTYEVLRGLVHSRDGVGDAYMEPADPEWAKWIQTTKDAVSSPGPLTAGQEAWVNTFLDPRAPRMNMAALRTPVSLTNSYSSVTQLVTAPPTGPHYVNAASLGVGGSYYVNNLTNNTSYYMDRDYIARVGDAGGWTNSGVVASPLPAAAQVQRPLLLNRPFRSVAELGYVFRDDPWKSLNLISANSGDGGLLDIFYIGSGSPAASKATPSVIAGRMNLNSAAANSVFGATSGTVGSPTVNALLAQGLKDYLLTDASTVSTTISPLVAGTLSTNMVSFIRTNGPLVNLSDLPSLYPQTTVVTTEYPGLKGAREAMVRSLADSSNTRSWNLMIDVVAQSGKISPAAVNLNNFIVEGEKHYWLHVAIDRFTGEIIDQQLEPVWE